jgi:hypothetical protein
VPVSKPASARLRNIAMPQVSAAPSLSSFLGSLRRGLSPDLVAFYPGSALSGSGARRSAKGKTRDRCDLQGASFKQMMP